jgi:hypothetical protein
MVQLRSAACHISTETADLPCVGPQATCGATPGPAAHGRRTAAGRAVTARSPRCRPGRLQPRRRLAASSGACPAAAALTGGPCRGAGCGAPCPPGWSGASLWGTSTPPGPSPSTERPGSCRQAFWVRALCTSSRARAYVMQFGFAAAFLEHLRCSPWPPDLSLL